LIEWGLFVWLRAKASAQVALAVGSRLNRLILAEIEFLRRFFTERVPNEFFVAFRAQVVAKILVRRRVAVGIGRALIRIPKKLTDRFHMVIVKVCLGDLAGVVGGENFHFDHIAVIVSRGKLFAAEITRNM
jgi:hypothetical protein